MGMRIWAKKMMDNPPQDKKDMTPKDRWLVIASSLFDALLIGLLVYTLMANSCQICYQTGFGQQTFTQCKGYSDVMETGLPQEVVDLYNQEEKDEQQLIENSEEINNLIKAKSEGIEVLQT